jgi:hypothetical protein
VVARAFGKNPPGRSGRDVGGYGRRGLTVGIRRLGGAGGTACPITGYAPVFARLFSQERTPSRIVCNPVRHLIPSSWQIGTLPLKCRQSNQRRKKIN